MGVSLDVLGRPFLGAHFRLDVAIVLNIILYNLKMWVLGKSEGKKGKVNGQCC
jgi:hypothetical protein